MSDIFNPNGVQELVAGSNITLSPTSGVGIVTVSSTGGSGGNAPSGFQYNTEAYTSSTTLTAADISAPVSTPYGFINVALNLTGTLAGAANAQMPLVTSLVSNITNPTVGYQYNLRIINNSSGNFAWTPTTNTGWTLNNVVAIPSGYYEDFYITLNSLTTATLQGVSLGVSLMSGSINTASVTNSGGSSLTMGGTQQNLFLIGTNLIRGQIGGGIIYVGQTFTTTFANVASSSSAATVRFGFTGFADTNLTLSTEAPSTYFNMAQVRQHATGALTLQRDFRISGSTHSFVGASTATDVATLAIDSFGQAGTNATFTNAHGILIQTQAVAGTVTNASALTLNAPTGASTNYALWVQTGNVSFAGTIASGAQVITAASSNAFTVGANGTTNPVFNVDTSTASVATGINIAGAAAGSGVAFSVLSSGTNEGLSINTKGNGILSIQNTATGSITMGTTSCNLIRVSTIGTGQFAIQSAGFNVYSSLNGVHSFTPIAVTTASTVKFGYTGAADNTLTASTEAPSIYFNIGQTRTHSTGALTLQRDFRITGSTHAFVGASTATDVAVLGIDGVGQAGTNATFTNAHGILIQTIAVAGTVGTASAVTVNAPTGATTSYALWVQTGNTLLQTLTVNSATLITSNTTLTNNAGSSAGTLTNAPAVGNPTKWFPINDNGTVRNIPAW